MADSTVSPGQTPLTTSKPAASRRLPPRFVVVLGVVLVLLAVINLTREFGSSQAGLVTGLVIAPVLLALGRVCGLSWSDLGLSRNTLARGMAVASLVTVAVAIVYAIAAAIPSTRLAFLDGRYQLPVDRALFTSLVLIPLGTVLPEEIAFRSVLQGLFTHRRGTRWGIGLSSALFGIWHILPSLGLSSANPAVGALVGDGSHARALSVVGAVAFTGLAGLFLGELRRRSGSLLASGGLHWAVNGLGVLVAAGLNALGS